MFPGKEDPMATPVRKIHSAWPWNGLSFFQSCAAEFNRQGNQVISLSECLIGKLSNLCKPSTEPGHISNQGRIHSLQHQERRQSYCLTGRWQPSALKA